MILYTYFRSSAAFRVRIALNLKNLSVEQRAIHLLKKENRQPDFKAINPQGLVPYFVNGAVKLSQSLAIIEYLNECYPDPPLLPSDEYERAQTRAIALLIACDIHPLNNTRVLDYLGEELGADEERRKTWYRHWIVEGFTALEQILAERSTRGGAYCIGDQPTLADICLVPQVFNAQRFKVDLGSFPHIARIHETCMKLPAFDAAQPLKQPDAA
jgi:maleylpyruvate isomerase